MKTTIRPARREDAADLARLIDLAGEGMPCWLWAQSAAPGQTPEEVGRERAAREEGGFSYRNARVCVDGRGRIAGMLLSYRLPDPYELPGPGELPPVVRPLVRLEASAPGSWYVNAVAVYPGFRGSGIGANLMALAAELACAAGADSVSLIVASTNTGAKRLYERLGYTLAASEPIVAWGEEAHAGDWELMLGRLPGLAG